MKLKYRFVIRTVGGKKIAVAVGTDNEKFNGMIKLNDTAEFIFDLLNTKDVSEEDIVNGLIEKYSVDRETALSAVRTYIENLEKNGLLG